MERLLVAKPGTPEARANDYQLSSPNREPRFSKKKLHSGKFLNSRPGPCHAKLQAKLKIGEPNDIYEQEADRVAEQIMRMPDPVTQRKCAKCNEDEKEVLQAKELPGQALTNQERDVNPIVSDVLRSPGQPLDLATRSFMEPRLGHDFSRVRVYSDPVAEQSAHAVNASAYTVGHNIVFGAGQFAPRTHEGLRLIAHELTHVVQQSNLSGSEVVDGIFPVSGVFKGGTNKNEMLINSFIPELKNSRLTSLTVQRQPDLGSANQMRSCPWKSFEDAKEDIKTKLEMIEFLIDQTTALNALFISLKKGRICFPNFSEEEFLSLSSNKAFLDSDVKKSIESGYSRSIKSDDRRLIWAESSKPFAGYLISGFDPSNRFTNEAQRRRLGGKTTTEHRTASEFTTESEQTAKKSFEPADILVFSGHQYAQYKASGVWTDSKDTGWDIRLIPGPLNNVKLVISTSCATLCREAYYVWKPLFPNAIVLGYKKSAPLEGGTVANSFAKSLPKDLILDSSGVSSAVSTWKSVISTRHKGESSQQPGWLDVKSGKIEYWDGKSWKSLNASDETNKCYIKGDYSASWPDPRAATPP